MEECTFLLVDGPTTRPGGQSVILTTSMHFELTGLCNAASRIDCHLSLHIEHTYNQIILLVILRIVRAVIYGSLHGVSDAVFDTGERMQALLEPPSDCMHACKRRCNLGSGIGSIENVGCD